MLLLFRLSGVQSFLARRHSSRSYHSRYGSAMGRLRQSVVGLSSSENPTLDWKGSSHSTSGFVTHVLIPPEPVEQSRLDVNTTTTGTGVTVIDTVQKVLDNRRENESEAALTTELSADQLVQLGAVWFLPADAPRDPSKGGKPIRVATDATLQPGDYLRIHHYPRRFPAVKDYDWSAFQQQPSSSNQTNNNPGVKIAQNETKGWMVIDKPPMVPVHMTVDNSQENVAACLQQSILLDSSQPQTNTQLFSSNSVSKDDSALPYVTTPQRLDQNTSGLFVVATNKLFAKYFAVLLRKKTQTQLENQEPHQDCTGGSDGIHKRYKCLVCLAVSEDAAPTSHTNGASVLQAAQTLQNLAQSGQLMRHFLEPSIRSPKRFVLEPPPLTEEDDKENKSSSKRAWQECLLRIRKASNVYALVGNTAGEQLGQALWKDPTEDMPTQCQAVIELEIELLTGRTHQIRGQLAASGFPLVGDAQYGGSAPSAGLEGNLDSSTSLQQQLALQCCELEFIDPDIVTKKDGTEAMKMSTRWNQFRLGEAWWTPFLDAYNDQMSKVDSTEVTTMASDMSTLVSPSESSIYTDKDSANYEEPIPKPHLLPKRVQLSPGKNKYVLVRAFHRDDQEHWFVKSAAPNECGGPYHGNVAQDLREWIEAAGYKVEVTGGGRIDYRPEESSAVVYGFSYGFGRGDHQKAATLIQEYTEGEINASFDYTQGLY